MVFLVWDKNTVFYTESVAPKGKGDSTIPYGGAYDRIMKLNVKTGKTSEIADLEGAGKDALCINPLVRYGNHIWWGENLVSPADGNMGHVGYSHVSWIRWQYGNSSRPLPGLFGANDGGIFYVGDGMNKAVHVSASMNGPAMSEDGRKIAVIDRDRSGKVTGLSFFAAGMIRPAKAELDYPRSASVRILYVE